MKLKKRWIFISALGALSLCWIGLRIHFPPPRYDDPQWVFTDMLGSSWPRDASLCNWYFNNEAEAQSVFYFTGNTKDLKAIIKAKALEDFDESDKRNFNLFFSFHEAGFPDVSHWKGYAGNDDKSYDYMYIFISPDNAQGVCFSNSW